jgi:hypothetical protein
MKITSFEQDLYNPRSSMNKASFGGQTSDAVASYGISNVGSQITLRHYLIRQKKSDVLTPPEAPKI